MAIKPGSKSESDTRASDPVKPSKPIYLKDFEKISALLLDRSDIVHPARLEIASLPTKVAEVLAPGQKTHKPPQTKTIESDIPTMMDYFETLMRDIVLRESVTMDSERSIYQIDITRE